MGLKPRLTSSEWEYLLSLERFADAFADDEVGARRAINRWGDDDVVTDCEDEDIEAALDIIENHRRVFGLRSEPRPAALESVPGGSAPSNAQPGDIGGATPSDRVYGALAGLQASRLPEVVSYRGRFAPKGLIIPDGVPAFLHGQADCVQTWEDLMARRTREHRDGKRFDIETYPASLSYERVVYRGRRGGGLHRLTAVTGMLEERYGWSTPVCIRLVLCGLLPAGFTRSCGVESIARGSRWSGLGAVVVRAPIYAEQDDVLRLFAQARSMLGPGRGARFTERTAQAVVFAVERLMMGEPLAAIARAWSSDPRQAETFRKEVYRALGKVGPALGPPAIPTAGRKPRRLRPGRPASG